MIVMMMIVMMSLMIRMAALITPPLAHIPNALKALTLTVSLIPSRISPLEIKAAVPGLTLVSLLMLTW
jgi:hypothetical protein